MAAFDQHALPGSRLTALSGSHINTHVGWCMHFTSPTSTVGENRPIMLDTRGRGGRSCVPWRGRSCSFLLENEVQTHRLQKCAAPPEAVRLRA